jgi:hypothetical protein
MDGYKPHSAIIKYFPCGGGLENPHRSPASSRRLRKGNPVHGDITGTLCHWRTKIQRLCLLGWGLDARPTTLLCEKIIIVKSK